MLSDEYLTAVSQALLDIYGELEIELLIDVLQAIERTLKADNFNVARQIEIDDIYRRVLLLSTRANLKRDKQLQKVFNDAIKKSYNFDSKVFKDAGINPGKFIDQPYLVQIFNAGIEQTKNTLQNFSNTAALTAREDFINLVDKAYSNIALGKKDYNSAINESIKELAEKGIRVIDYNSGAKYGLDSAVRRATLTGVSQTALKVTDQLGDELDADLVETSSHWGARDQGTGPENHKSWQGRIFSKSGTHKKYPHFKTVTGYGTGEGLGGWNCRHSFYPFIEGVSTPNPKVPEKADVKFNNKTYTFYEATQRQRQIERHIRRWKREEALLKKANQDTSKAIAKIKEWQKEARDFTAQTGIRRRYDLERIMY